MPNAFVGPIGPFPSERQSTAKPPSNHSQVSWFVIFPPGMKGFGFMSPSVVHLPTKYPSFLCSGPGFGFSPGACASASPDDRTQQTARFKSLDLMSHLRGLAGIVAPLGVDGSSGHEGSGTSCHDFRPFPDEPQEKPG